MRSKNFVSFLTVQGFFIGFIFSILKSENAEDFLSFTLFITVFFYLFAHFIISFFIRYTPLRQEYFPKVQHEHNLDHYVKEISKREKVIENSCDFLESLHKKYDRPKKVRRKAS